MTVVILGGAIDWTQVLVALIAGLPATIAVVLGYLNRQQLKTPSGDTIGAVVEQTHALTAVNTAMIQDVHKATANGGPNGAVSRTDTGRRGDVEAGA